MCVLITILLYLGQIGVFWRIFLCGFAHFFFSVNELNALCHRHRGTAHHLYSFACVIIDITEESGMGLGR